MESTIKDVWSVREVAQHLGITERLVLTMIQRGELPAAKLGRSYRIRRTAVERLLDGHAS